MDTQESLQQDQGPTDLNGMDCETVVKKQKVVKDLQRRKKQLEFYAADLLSEKRRYNRMVRLMVRMLQQEILNRGKVLARQIDDKMEGRIAEVKATLEALHGHIQSLQKEDQEEPDKEDDVAVIEPACSEFEASSMQLPSRDPFAIDMQSIVSLIQSLQVTSQDYVDEPFPDREELIKVGEEQEVSGVGFWDSQRPTFHLMPRAEQSLGFLYRHSQNVRRTYLRDSAWQTFEDSGTRPEPANRVFACHPDDRCWYRALVMTNMADQSESSVRFIDYGETKQVPWSDLLPCREELYTDAKPWAFECTFADDIDPKKCQDARWYFNSTLYDISRACVPLTCTPIKQVPVGEDLVWMVELTVVQNDGSILNIGKEVRDRLFQSQAQSAIACRDIREEFQNQLSEIEKEREMQKLQKEREKQQSSQNGPDSSSVNPQNGPDSSTANPQTGPDSSAANPQNGPDSSTANPQTGPDSTATNPQNGPDSSAANPQNDPDSSAANPQNGPDSSVANPQIPNTSGEAVQSNNMEVTSQSEVAPEATDPVVMTESVTQIETEAADPPTVDSHTTAEAGTPMEINASTNSNNTNNSNGSENTAEAGESGEGTAV